MQELNKIKKFLQEAKDYIGKGDFIQSSEKLYKIVEDGIKLLAKEKRTKEYRRVIRSKSKRWHTNLLEDASYTLSSILNNKLIKKCGLSLMIFMCMAFTRRYGDWRKLMRPF